MQAGTDIRSFIALTDLGEGKRLQSPDNPNILPAQGDVPASNEANRLFEMLSSDLGIRAGRDEGLVRLGLQNALGYEKIISGRRLRESEYDLHRSLGYLSLNRRLQNDEVLAVSYEYTYNGEQYRVGELSEDYQSLGASAYILLKMLRPASIQPESTTWDLMMKNVYSLNAFQLQQENFELRIYYRDDREGLNNPSLNEGENTRNRPLIELLGLDRLNATNDPPRDGNFDFVPGITVKQEKGLIIFPVLEPFGETLKGYFDEEEESHLIQKYVFNELYEDTQADARQIYEKDLFTLEGQYKASSGGGEYQLPSFGVIPNSVGVMAGGVRLQEGIDYTVDYGLGKVRILNQGVLASGKEININFEKSDVISTQSRSLLGTRFEYQLSDYVNLGSTMIYLADRPGSITRYQVGAEPIRNLKYGLDLSYEQESPLLTQSLDALPLISTKEPSKIRMAAEFAQLVPGTSNQVGGEGTFYLESFESASVPIELGGAASWQISTPLPDQFNLAGLEKGYRRAAIAWYSIDNAFYRLGIGSLVGSQEDLGPAGINNHYVRMIRPREIFPNRDVELGITNEPIFNVAYFPSERGPYNYNPDLNEKGHLKEPENNWGGITRSVASELDFERASIEYFEFWMMDPFLEGEKGRIYDGVFNENNRTGGDLIFHLGQISEDLNHDGQLFYENGLPADESLSGIQESDWGRYSIRPIINRSFVNTNALSRRYQDVGFDGLHSDFERSFFYESFLERLSVPEGVLSDIREDPSSDDFRFYLDPYFDEKEASIIERYKYFNRPEGNTPLPSGGPQVRSSSSLPENEDLNRDNTINKLNSYYEYVIPLRPGDLEVGKGRVVDKIRSGDVNWYLFRVPITSSDGKYGSIRNFKSIKFMRLFLTGFSQPVVLRMTKFHLVRSEWRRYNQSLHGVRGQGNPLEDKETSFDISSVSLEENGTSTPGKSPYVLPPGVQRDRDDFSLAQTRNNERSLQLCVDNLKDNDARGVFKSVQQNLVNYKYLKMFFHVDGENLEDGDISGFIRIGTDLKRNYYEIEIPLEVTPPFVRGVGDDVARKVWPEANEIDLLITEFYKTKLERDEKDASLEEPYSRKVGRHTISVLGRPRISAIRIFMVGIRNPEGGDGLPKNACLWANELRVVGVDRKSAWGSSLSFGVDMADFANITSSFSHKTVGFGEVQERVFSRAQFGLDEYDISANVNLDKLIPGKTGIRIPMFTSYQNSVEEPEYNPLDPDVPLEKALEIQEDRDAFEDLVQDRTVQRSLNFTNVGKERVKADAKPRIYDLENLSFNYSYSDTRNTNVSLAERLQTKRAGGARYSYSIQNAYIEPFKDSPAFQNPFLGPIKAFNLNPLPNTLDYGVQLERNLTRTQFRNSSLNIEGVEPIYEKIFSFRRNYGLQWSIIRGTSLQYRTNVLALIDEPFGYLDTEEKRADVRNQLLEFGRMKNYDQKINLTHDVPLKSFPLTDWLKTSVNYGVGYLWQGGALQQADSLGHSMENKRNIGLNQRADFSTIYKKIPLFRRVEGGSGPQRGGGPGGGGQSPKVAPQDLWIKWLFKPILMFRSANANYSLTQRTNLPGVTVVPYIVGMDSTFQAPGYAFVLGDQNPDIRHLMSSRGWMVKSSLLTMPFEQESTQQITGNLNLEPIDALSLQINLKRSTQRGYQEIYRYDAGLTSYRSLTPSQVGSYSASFLSIQTVFQDRDYAFTRLENYRRILKARWDLKNPLVNYPLNSQEVLASSFIAAYSETSPNAVSLNPFLRSPMPNWQLSYSGLTGILGLITDFFSNITLTHAYSSTYSVGNFSSSLLYDRELELQTDPFGDGLLRYPLADRVSERGHVPFYIINQISLRESFAPLIGVSLGFAENMNLRTEYRRRRDVALNFSNNQVSETYTRDIVFNYTYSQEDSKIPFDFRGESYVLENTLSFQANLTLRNSSTLQKILEGSAVEVVGNDNYQYRISADYDLNESVNWQVYLERRINNPRISLSNPLSNLILGTQLRISWDE
ncbi:MAG: cell surface protein SprA [Cytophagales bacterium]|nr:cell surface protein SprA [Cytophagales bacterium]